MRDSLLIMCNDNDESQQSVCHEASGSDRSLIQFQEEGDSSGTSHAEDEVLVVTKNVEK